MPDRTTQPDLNAVSPSTQNYPFLAGGGQMGSLTRSYDWRNSPLGSPDQWPQSLRSIVSMLLASKFPMFLWWGPELIQFYNDAYRLSLGNEGKHPRALGQRGEECWPETWPDIKPLIDQVLGGGEATWSQDQLLPIYRNGKLEDVYWTYSYSPVRDESGQVAGVLVVCQETTQQVISRQKNEQTQREVLAYFEQSSVGIAIIGRDNLTFRMANSFYGELVGRSPQQLINKPLLEAVPELTGQGFDKLLQDVITTGTPYIAPEVAVSLVRHNQLETIYVDLAYQPLHEADNTVSGVLVIATDVTAQVRSRKAVESSEARLRSVVDSAPFPIGVYIGSQMRIELANQSIIEIWGKGPDVIGKRYADVLPELANQSIFDQLDQVYRTGVAFQARSQRVDIVVDGKLQPFYFNYDFTPLFDAQGNIYGVMNTAAEITALVVAKQQLEEAESGLRVAIELAQLGTWSIDVVTNGLTFSDRLLDWFGYDPQQQAYTQVIPLIEANDQQRVEEAVAWALHPESGGLFNEIYTIIHPKTGQKRILHAQGKTVFDTSGKAIRLNGTAQDITIQREAQLALEREVQLRTQELEATNEELNLAIEELAATNEEYAAINEELTAASEEVSRANKDLEEANLHLIRSNQNLEQFAYIASHDLQEPLRKIQQFGDLLKSKYAEAGSEELAYLSRMQLAANRMSLLIRDLLTFSRISTSPAPLAGVPLKRVMEEVLDNLSVAIEETRAHIEVGNLPVVPGDAIQLGQLFQNLLSNALKFRRPGVVPHISILTQPVLDTDLPPAVKPARQVGTYLRIAVVDNGIGFHEKYLDRIFQVFQRLHGKNEFAGSGVGLAICQKVVTNHGGAITASSSPGHGATFTVYLPI